MGCRNLRRTGMEREEFVELDRASKLIILGAVDASSRPVADAPPPRDSTAQGFSQPFQALEFNEFRGGGP
jgi:hypothetical protein